MSKPKENIGDKFAVIVENHIARAIQYKDDEIMLRTVLRMVVASGYELGLDFAGEIVDQVHGKQ